MTSENIIEAKALTKLGLWVFPVLVTDNPDNPWKKNKRPAIPEAHPAGDPLHKKCTGECGKRGHGFYDATNDYYYVEDLFERYPNARVGVYMEPSGLVAADFDVVRDREGNVLIDGFENFETYAWEDLPATWAYDSVSGAGGRQYLYLAPEGVKLGPAGKYRGWAGVDRRGGGSYSVWCGPVPNTREVFKPAPEWLLDPATVRSTERFEGTVKEWMDSLEPGEPSLIVRAAMDRTRKVFEDAGNDFDHAAMVERQFEAIRLGSEGHSGVGALLDLIETLFLSREGSHSRTPEEWDWEWTESLASGIANYGDAIELRKNLVPYSLSIVPSSVPDRLVTGTDGTKQDFTDLLRALLAATDDDNLVLSVLWGSPKTKTLAHEWGVPFVHERVTSARLKPEPVRENPTLPEPAPVTEKKAEISVPSGTFLSAEEVERVKNTETFIDRYLAASKTKGFYTREYAVAAAWTALSMSFGTKAYIPKGVSIPMNIWILGLGNSGTGKSGEFSFLKSLLDVRLKDGEGYYNLGAHSSPEGLHEELLMRDNKPSMILHDEASSFFSAMKTKDWMGALEYHMSDWYMGGVEPMNKVRLKDLKGKSATTSFNIHMIGTPDRLMELIDTEMFATGFLARYNFFWAPEPVESDLQYEATLTVSEKGVNPTVFELGCDLSDAASVLDAPVMVGATEEARKRLVEAFKAFDKSAKSHERYAALEPAIKRLGRETLWKMAALTALYRGDEEILLEDALVAVHYAQDWYRDLIRVVEATSESDFSRDVNEIEAYVKSQGGSVSEAKVNHRFRSMIRRSPRELSERLDFLRISGRLNRSEAEGRVMYTLNGQ